MQIQICCLCQATKMQKLFLYCCLSIFLNLHLYYICILSKNSRFEWKYDKEISLLWNLDAHKLYFQVYIWLQLIRYTLFSLQRSDYIFIENKLRKPIKIKLNASSRIVFVTLDNYVTFVENKFRTIDIGIEAINFYDTLWKSMLRWVQKMGGWQLLFMLRR